MLSPKIKTLISSSFLLIFSSSLSLLGAEVFLRVKNSGMDNYDIEMWRYSNLLKRKSPNEVMDFEHQKNKKAKLQNVEIRINNMGLRGEDISELKTTKRRILFLGGSITLGWGVEEEYVLTSKLQKMFDDFDLDVEVLNAGIGNYNASRYVTRYFNNLDKLKPTDIVVHYFLRDAENLLPAKQNFLLKNSQLAVTTWTAFNRLFNKSGENSLVKHYQNIYKKNNEGFIKMKENLALLANFSRKNNINIYLIMTPDITNLKDYKFSFIHEIMMGLSKELGYKYADTLPSFLGIDFEDLYAMPGDPHPNRRGHQIIADIAFPLLIENKK